MYAFSENSNLGASVQHFLSVPIMEQTGLLNELALARAAMTPVIRLYETFETRLQKATTDAERDVATTQLVVVSERLHAAIDRVASIAEKCQRVQKDQLITPATVAVLAGQLELIGRELLFDTQPTLYDEFAIRVQQAIGGTIIVADPTDTSRREVARPAAICAAMDETVPAPDGWNGKEGSQP